MRVGRGEEMERERTSSWNISSGEESSVVRGEGGLIDHGIGERLGKEDGPVARVDDFDCTGVHRSVDLTWMRIRMSKVEDEDEEEDLLPRKHKDRARQLRDSACRDEGRLEHRAW